MPPKEKSIQLRPGQLYINDEPFGGLSEAPLEGAEVSEELPEIVRSSCSGEFTATIECTETFIETVKAMQQAVREYVSSCSGEFTATIEYTETFIENVKAMQQAAQEYVQRIIDYYIEITLDACPNPRVVHLVSNGRKARTRKKNWRRAERYYYETKEAEQ